MVARLSFISTGGPVAALYYLKETQPEWERNQDLEYQLKDIPMHDGTVPIFQRNIAPQLTQAFRLDMDAMRENPLPQLENLFSGLRADGEPTGKRAQAAYTRSDGKEFVQKIYFDVTVSNHISVGLAMANAETPAGRALIYSAALDANQHAMERLADRIGWTRQGAGGSGGEVRAFPLIITFPHHATRPTQNGFVAPSLHFHNIVFSAVATESGRVGALWMMKFKNESITKTKIDYHNRFENNLNKLKIETQRQDNGSVIFSAVPKQVNEFFAQRSIEILARAEQNAQKKGIDLDSLSAKSKQKFIQNAVYQTRGGAHDGVARTAEWRLQFVRLNWHATDAARLAFGGMNAILESGSDAYAMRQAYQRTWQQTRQARQQAQIRQAPAVFNVKLKRQIVAATLALQLNQFQPLKQDFINLAKSFSENHIKITQRLTGRKLVHSLTPLFVGMQKMSQTLSTIQTQPLQKDHESLGGYLAQKHKLSSEYGARIAAAGEMVQSGRMDYSEAVNSLARGEVRLEHRVSNAVSDAVTFYDGVRLAKGLALVGPYKADGPVVFTSSFGDAALARDATGGKLTIVAGYGQASRAQIMAEWRAHEPKREFIQLADAGVEPAVSRGTPDSNTAIASPPPNAAQANDWQSYAKNYGVSAVANSMRQTYKMEFRQSQKQSMAAE